jgi:hypothetical protein
VALAGLGDLPDTILTRSVVVRMRRRAPSEIVEPFRRRVNGPDGEHLRERLEAWAGQTLARSNSYPDMPDTINDRDADVWEPLLSVADAAGGHWPVSARRAAVALVADSKRKTPSLGLKLLADIKSVFGESDSLGTEEILTRLHKMDESPWGDLKGKALDARGLARRLSPYDIKPINLRTYRGVVKGYCREDLHDAWERYLGPSPQGSATTATLATIRAEAA